MHQNDAFEITKKQRLILHLPLLIETKWGQICTLKIARGWKRIHHEWRSKRSRVQTLTTSKFFFPTCGNLHTYSGRHFHMEINNWALQKKNPKKKRKNRWLQRTNATKVGGWKNRSKTSFQLLKESSKYKMTRGLKFGGVSRIPTLKNTHGTTTWLVSV